jgi:hypothetical protein
MNLVQALHTTIQIGFTQQQMLIPVLEKLLQTKSLLVRRYSNDEIEISFSTIRKTQLATALTDVELYNFSKVEVELVKTKSEIRISVDEDIDSFLPKCRFMIWNLYDALRLGNYRRESMNASITELVINELGRLLCLDLHSCLDLSSNSSSDERIKQALIDKLGLSNEDEIAKAIQSIRLLVPIRNVFTRLVYFKAYREIRTMGMTVGSMRSHAKLAELRTEIKTIKHYFNNSCEINLFLFKENKIKFYRRAEFTLSNIQRIREDSTNNKAKVLRYIRDALNALAEHRTPNLTRLIQSYDAIKMLINGLDGYFLLDEDEAYLKQYLKSFNCFKSLYDAMKKLGQFENSFHTIERFKARITGTNNEHFVPTKELYELTYIFTNVSEALYIAKTSHDDILLSIDNVIESIDEFLSGHNAHGMRLQLLFDEREYLIRLKDEFDANCEMVETQSIPFYMRKFELIFIKEDVQDWYNQFDFANTGFLKYTSDLHGFLEKFRRGVVRQVEQVAKILSPEQFNLIREMFVRCSEHLASKLSEYKKVPEATLEITNASKFSLTIYGYVCECEKIIECEQCIERALQFHESKRGIVSKCLIEPLLSCVKIFEPIFKRDVLAWSTKFNLDNSNFSDCIDALLKFDGDLLNFSEAFEFVANKIVIIKSYLSPEQFTSMQEMFATCLRCLAYEFSKHNDLFKKVFESGDADLSEIRIQIENIIHRECEEIIKFEQRVERALQFSESERGIVSKGFIEPLLSQTKRVIDYITARQNGTTELQMSRERLVQTNTQLTEQVNMCAEKSHIIQKEKSIICTCVSGIIALIAATYLLLGNFLFKFIIPFCALNKYIFIGSIGLVSLFSTVITIIRFCSIYCYSDLKIGKKNSNCLSNIFLPYMSLEPNISSRERGEAIEQ